VPSAPAIADDLSGRHARVAASARRRSSTLSAAKLETAPGGVRPSGNPLNVSDPAGGAAPAEPGAEDESNPAAARLHATWLREWKPLLTRLEQRLGRIAGVTLDAETDPVMSAGVALYRVSRPLSCR
jgi:hypothetical protein